MNRFKPYFVLSFGLICITIVGVAALHLVQSFSITWLGALLSVVPFLGFFLWTTYVKKTPRSKANLPLLTLTAFAGLALGVYGYFTEDVSDKTVGLAAAVVGTVGFILYTNWYSILNRRLNAKLAVGKQIPNFEVQDRDGETVRSESLLGQPALLLFYRGGWCPICMAHVDEVASRYRGLIERGVQVALISPQPPDLTRRVADIYDVAFQFWVDTDSSAAKALEILDAKGVPVGLRNKYGGDTVLPTAIIIDATGKIIFTDQTDNYRVRPNPDLFIEALAAHGY